MGRSQAIAAGLAAGSIAAGVAAVAVDASALGVVAGLAGAAGVAVLASTSAKLSEQVRDAAAKLSEVEAALADATTRAAEAETSLAALEAAHDAELSPEEDQALIDPTTGMYGERFFAVSLTSRVAAARRHLRPVAVVLVEVAAGVKDGNPAPADAALVATQVKKTLREADTACYLEGCRFGLLLEDTPENGAVWTVERLRRALNVERKNLTLWAGVACYPAHAFDAGELLERATAALEAAREWRQDRIEVATTSDV